MMGEQIATLATLPIAVFQLPSHMAGWKDGSVIEERQPYLRGGARVLANTVRAEQQVVRDAWGATSLFDHYLASKGFLVWSLDNRGSWGRGHAWEAAIFKETGKRELADQLAGVSGTHLAQLLASRLAEPPA